MNSRSSSLLSASVLSWLRCFDAAARFGSFTKAAEVLHVSQGAVSQQVKKLEERLGHVLLLRTAGGLQLTPKGDQLFSTSSSSFDGLESVLRRLQAAHLGEAVNLRCSPSFAMFWLTLRLGSFNQNYPHIALRIVGESDYGDSAKMSRDGIAAAVRFNHQETKDSRAVRLFDEWLVPVATASFVQSHPELKDARDLNGSQLLHAADPWEGTESTQEWSHWLGAVGAAMPPSALRRGTQFNHSLLAMQAALGGQGIAMGRMALVLGYLMQGRLVAPFPCRVRLSNTYQFVGDMSSPEMPIIREWLLDEARIFTQQREAYFQTADIRVVGEHCMDVWS
jgi:DNA-binding transcriptional LysR family regulator